MQSLFRINKSIIVSQSLIAVNVGVFVLMAITGVSVLSPNLADLISWGANYGPLTLSTDPWRLLTCNFIHLGFLHLLFNMYALLYLGYLLEPLLGKIRFLTLYLICGVFSSSWSLFWSAERVSAGASGAIFGLFGFFFCVLLMKKEWIESAARQALLKNMALLLAINLGISLLPSIDGAGHFGGFIIGMASGVFLLAKENRIPLSNTRLIGYIIFSFIMIFSFYVKLTDQKIIDPLVEMNRINKNDNKAYTIFEDLIYNYHVTKDKMELQDSAQEAISLRNSNQVIINQLLNLKTINKTFLLKAENYNQVRLEILKIIANDISNQSGLSQNKIMALSQEANTLKKEMLQKIE